MKNEILNTFIKTCENFPGNSNSLHKLGTDSKKLENASTKQILDVLKLKNKEVIYVSDRSEANSLLIFGLLKKYEGKNKNIIITKEEDPSIIESLEKLNFKINYINKNDNKITISDLEKYINDETILISISNISNIKEVIELVKKYRNCHYHLELNKNIDLNILNDIDFITIYDNDLPGIASLIKNKNISLEPIIHGGKSSTIYRSGTPNLPFITSFSKLIKLKYKK